MGGGKEENKESTHQKAKSKEKTQERRENLQSNDTAFFQETILLKYIQKSH